MRQRVELADSALDGWSDASMLQIEVVPDATIDHNDSDWRRGMARKTIRISDISGEEIPDGKGATVRITFSDARKGSRELDVTDAEAERLGGRTVSRRGRKPKLAS
jgi:hypothetical protein